MEKLLLEACLEMMAVPVGGWNSRYGSGWSYLSTCETASRGDSGIEIVWTWFPSGEAGMNSYEIMLSESQERMLVIKKR